MTLGSLIETLAALKADLPIRFADGSIPRGLRSWRGSYDELTIDHDIDGQMDTVGKLLADARRAVGSTFQGYKGGDYVMHESTPVWADEWGEYRSIAPAGIAVNNGIAVIHTSDLSDYR